MFVSTKRSFDDPPLECHEIVVRENLQATLQAAIETP